MKNDNKKPRGFKKLGLDDPAQILLIAPKGYDDFSHYFEQVSDGHYYCGPAKVMSLPHKNFDQKFWSFNAEIEGYIVRIAFFGQFYQSSDRLPDTSDWGGVRVGRKIYVKGEFKQFGKQLYLTGSEKIPDKLFDRISPNYKSIRGVIKSDRIKELVLASMFSKAHIERAVSILKSKLDKFSPSNDWLTDHLWNLHMPSSVDEFEYAMSVSKKMSVKAIVASKTIESVHHEDASIKLDWFMLQQYKKRLPFTLSKSQDDAIEGVVEILESNQVMTALLSGDVGTGKTITYMLPAIAAYQAGKKVAVLAPNTPLAKQIADEFKECFPEIVINYITGGKKDITEEELGGIWIGTTAVISLAKKQDWKADFLIIDEQQKFSIEQKKSLTHEYTNVLEATATCIPQTLGMIKHGNMKIFRLYAHANKTIHTRIVGNEQKREVKKHIDSVIAAGDRAVIIYPQMNTDLDNYKRNVLAAAQKWEDMFPGKVVLIHGALNDIEKARALSLAKSGERPVIVATSIIEVGITIPRLRLGVVVSADRYGLSTLHQMRGRIARDGGIGHFYLLLGFDIENNQDDNQRKIINRLAPIVKTQDGFELAEMDAKNRGFGDILNESGAQHGKTEGLFMGLVLTETDFEVAV